MAFSKPVHSINLNRTSPIRFFANLLPPLGLCILRNRMKLGPIRVIIHLHVCVVKASRSAEPSVIFPVLTLTTSKLCVILGLSERELRSNCTGDKCCGRMVAPGEIFSLAFHQQGRNCTGWKS
jgi:hypothetical protein